MPYRDFRVEYPPGALAPFVVPALVSSSPHGFDAAFETLMVMALIAAAVADRALAGRARRLDREHRPVGRRVPRGCRTARAVRADALRSLRRHPHAGGGLRDPVPPASARAGAARGRDRDEDLPGRAPAAARGAHMEARGEARGADGARAQRGYVAADLPAVRDPRARGRRAQRLAPARAAVADREPGLGRVARAPPRARHAARLGVRVGLAEPDRNRCRGSLGRDDDRRRGGAPARLGALCPRRRRRAMRGSSATRPRRSLPSWRSARSSHPSS